MGFECEFCGKKFESEKGLKLHKSKVHPRAVETKIDKMLEYVKSEGKVSLGKISEELELDDSKVEEWGKVLDRYELVKLVYPENPLRSPFLKVENGKSEEET